MLVDENGCIPGWSGVYIHFGPPPVRSFIGLKETDNEQYPYNKKEKKRKKKGPSQPTNHIEYRVGLVPEGSPWDATDQTWFAGVWSPDMDR